MGMEDGGDTKVRMTAGRLKERMKNASTIGWRGHPCEGEKAALGDETKKYGKAVNATRLGTHKTLKTPSSS
jgi:hypothetical protein